MKTKILMLVVLMGFTTILMAQPAKNDSEKPARGQEWRSQMKNGQHGPMNELNLTDAQKEAFKQSMLAMQKKMQPIRNELDEAEAHQKTLMTAEKPEMDAINKNIEKIGSLKTEMVKIQVNHRLEMRAQLSEEQRLKFDMMNGRMKHGKDDWAKNHGKGMNRPMQLQNEHEMN
jgi:Spy/CpxP family protein refolding chaperone